MTRPVKREPPSSVTGGKPKRRKGASSADKEQQQQQFRSVNREPRSRNRVEDGQRASAEASQQGDADRRVLRSHYLAVKTLIRDERDNLLRPDSDKFSSIINEVDTLHQQVQKPREQVADAEALLDIASTLVTSVKSQSSEGITPAIFLTFLLEEFGQTSQGLGFPVGDEQVSVRWKDLGIAVSPIFRKFHGYCTMLGPMSTQMKQRKVPAQRRHGARLVSVRPEELDDPGIEEKTDTDRNMATMFDILRRKRSVRLEYLILNRKSFAQTVENLFALSFLVKDGRAQITVDPNGVHFVSPKNAPAAGSVSYNHFVFRFDFRDWKLMMDAVPSGEELTPHRNLSINNSASNTDDVERDSQGELQTTPIRKLTRNRGLVIQEETVVEDSPETKDDDSTTKRIAIGKCKRKLHREKSS